MSLLPMIRPVLLTLTIAVCGVGAPNSAMGQAPTTEAQATRALATVALMASCASEYTNVVASFAALVARSQVSDQDLRRVNAAIVNLENGRSYVSSPSFHTLTDALLADAVRSDTLGDPFIAALLAAREAADAAIVPGWDSSGRTGDRELVRLAADAGVLRAAVRFGRAAFSALEIAVERANDSRATAAEIENRAAAENVGDSVDTALGRAAAAARFNAVWENALKIGGSSELEGVAFLALEQKLMRAVYSAANEWRDTIPSAERR